MRILRLIVKNRRKRAGRALSAIRTRLRELQRAVGARDEFIATVAHELRNPIAPLTFQVRLALNKAEQFAAAGTPVSVEWIQTQLRGMERRLHRLLETLDRLLDVSRLSSGRIDLQAEPMDLAEAVREVIDAFDAELAVARCKVTLSVLGTATGTWDRLRVEQVCRNLLSNAIRFGAGRPIEVAVVADHDFRPASRFATTASALLPISSRRSSSDSSEVWSSGMVASAFGLWIVRNICVAMGGTVSVDSTLGDGGVFHRHASAPFGSTGVVRLIGATSSERKQHRSERHPTGIEGLDRILDGGFLVAGVYIVQGPPGAGKTILANQTCFNHAAAGGRAVYVTLLAESHSRMFAHLRRMAFFDESVIPGPRLLHRRLQRARSGRSGRPRHPDSWRHSEAQNDAAGCRRAHLRTGILTDRSGVQAFPA
jgi:hypothetical protein